jgi:hypothetical protein
MQKLNPIQLLEITDIVNNEIDALHKKLVGKGNQQLTISKINNLQKSLPILIAMYGQALKDEDRIYAGENFVS